MTKHSNFKVANDGLWLGISSGVLLLTFIVNGLCSSPDPQKWGFKNSTAAVSNLFTTQITPAGFTFAIWGIIYSWQILWLVYGWSFTCRPNADRSISSSVYIGFTLVNALSIVWLYVWGNEIVIGASIVLFLVNIAFYPTIFSLFANYNDVKANLTKVDVYLTRIFPINGLCFYATWTTIASLINLAAALQYSGGYSASLSGTVSLTILLGVLIAYFVLENTVLDRFGFRFVFSVYPVVIWALIGVLTKHVGAAGEGRNVTFSAILLGITCLIFFGRISLVILFMRYRPLTTPTFKRLQ